MGKTYKSYDEEFKNALFKAFYEKNGIKEGKNLIVTFDDENGGLDSSFIDGLIKRTFDL